MSFDHSDVDVDEHADRRHPGTRSADQAAEAPQDHRSVDAGSAADIAQDTSFRLPTAEERIEAHWRARQDAGEAYAAWDRTEGTTDTSAEADRPSEADRAPEGVDQASADDRPATQPSDKPSTTEEALRTRVSELEADKAVRDRQLTAQAKTIAEQDQRIDRLEAYVGQITTAVRELRQQDEPRPGAGIAERAGGGEAERAEWAERQHKRRLPTDVVNNVISIAAGATVTEVAYHFRDLPPEAAGIAASGIAFGAGMIAVWRERRKVKDDAIHRPKG
jgi:uncharacterized coiled-coil protein SlyX